MEYLQVHQEDVVENPKRRKLSVGGLSFDFIPEELLLHVFEFLPWETLETVRLVCWTWKLLADELLHKSFWSSACSENPNFDEAFNEVLHHFAFAHSRPTVGIMLVSPSYKLGPLKLLQDYVFKHLPQKTQLIGAVVEGIIGTTPSGIKELETDTALSLSLGNLGPNSIVETFDMNSNPLSENVDWKLLMVLSSRVNIRVLETYLHKLQSQTPSTQIVGGIVDGRKGFFRLNHGEMFIATKGVIGLAVGEPRIPKSEPEEPQKHLLQLEQTVNLPKYHISCKGFASKGCAALGPCYEIAEMTDNNLISSFLCHGALHDAVSVYVQLSQHQMNQEMPLYLYVVNDEVPPAFPPITDLIMVLGLNSAQKMKVSNPGVLQPNMRVQFYEMATESTYAHLKHSLAAQGSASKILGGIQFQCCARGSEFYGKRHAEAHLFQSILPNVPLTGVSCNGEICSMGQPGSFECALMGYTSVFGIITEKKI